ncbi:MliC family protein [Vibrio methylphosphonaticus]|uniref:MliC family protein n=1 Tax=Vibrio methylphosphonaticus TaxID=2946866 RepID=UPI002029DB57|nr:MliC family protein [Vibrio methylphosphonaticus]MCL9773263.1 MliC family protein [Vibrio methylphosphonaticus]
MNVYKWQYWLVGSLLIAVSGCSQQTDDALQGNHPNHQSHINHLLEPILYQCDSAEFVVTPLDDEQVLVLIDGTEHHLHRVPSASGVKYTLEGQLESDAEVALFTKGKQAMLTISSQTYKNCMAK